MSTKFKKRKRQASAFKRSQDADVLGEDESDLSIVQELRESQAMRERVKGVTNDRLVNPQKKKVVQGIQSEPAGGDKTTAMGLTRWAAASQEATEGENPHMIAYIEEKLGKKITPNEEHADDSNKVKDQFKLMEEEVDLYGTKRQQLEKEKTISTAETSQVEDPNAGGPVIWSAGIAEVELPDEYRMKNIQETEMATRLMKEKRENKNGSANTSEIPGNVTANYKKFGREYAQKMNSDERAKSRGKHLKSSDDRAATQFARSHRRR